MPPPHALVHERRCVRRAILRMLPDLAAAMLHARPSEADLRETLQARHDQLAALDLRIASYSPQAGLFADWSGQEG